mgnify:CR=1 FL=1
MKYQLATEKVRFQNVAVMVSTNCKDKVNGHAYTHLSKKEADAARKALKLHEGITIYKCSKCKKIKQSM